LAKLTADEDEEVRDWATFGLGVLGDIDTVEIREALAARLSDANDDAREEAVVGLAKPSVSLTNASATGAKQ
jgi:HEAT repeat protein